VNTKDGPTKLVRQDAILGGLLMGQFCDKELAKINTHQEHIEDAVLSTYKFINN